MSPTFFEIGLAIVLVVIAGSLVAWYLKYKSSRSRSRMARMLVRYGVDPELIESADHEAIKRAVRQRCEKCQAEDICERWLSGEVEGNNEFCPNRRVFDMLAEETRLAG